MNENKRKKLKLSTEETLNNTLPETTLTNTTLQTSVPSDDTQETCLPNKQNYDTQNKQYKWSQPITFTSTKSVKKKFTITIPDEVIILIDPSDKSTSFVCSNCWSSNGNKHKCIMCDTEVLDVTPKLSEKLCTVCIDNTKDSQCGTCGKKVICKTVANNAENKTPASDSQTKWTCNDCWVQNSEKENKCVCCGGKKPETSANTIPEKENNTSSVITQTNNNKWTCNDCWVSNNEDVNKCVCCGGEKPKSSKQITSPINLKTDSDEKNNVKVSNSEENKWTCNDCWVRNNEDADKCVCCGGVKPKQPECTNGPTNIEVKTNETNVHKPIDINANKWTCKDCSLANNEEVIKCASCGGLKTNISKEADAQVNTNDAKTSKWTCNDCWVTNDNSNDKCVCCGGKKPSDIKKSDETNTDLKNDQTSVNTDNKWKCKVCLVQNYETDKKCICCDNKKPSPSLNNVETDNNSDINKWTCNVCGLANIETDKECICCGGKGPNMSTNKIPETNKWACNDCYVSNVDTSDKCVCCGAKKPQATSTEGNNVINNNSQENTLENHKKTEEKKKSQELWKCEVCSRMNEYYRPRCFCCETHKPGTKFFVNEINKALKDPKIKFSTVQGIENHIKNISEGNNAESSAKLSDKDNAPTEIDSANKTDTMNAPIVPVTSASDAVPVSTTNPTFTSTESAVVSAPTVATEGTVNFLRSNSSYSMEEEPFPTHNTENNNTTPTVDTKKEDKEKPQEPVTVFGLPKPAESTKPLPQFSVPTKFTFGKPSTDTKVYQFNDKNETTRNMQMEFQPTSLLSNQPGMFTFSSNTEKKVENPFSNFTPNTSGENFTFNMSNNANYKLPTPRANSGFRNLKKKYKFGGSNNPTSQPDNALNSTPATNFTFGSAAPNMFGSAPVFGAQPNAVDLQQTNMSAPPQNIFGVQFQNTNNTNMLPKPMPQNIFGVNQAPASNIFQTSKPMGTFADSNPPAVAPMLSFQFGSTNTSNSGINFNVSIYLL